MRSALQTVRVGQEANPHSARNSSNVVCNQPDHIERIALNVFGKVRNRINKLANMNRQIQRRTKLNQSFLVSRANWILKPGIVQLIQQPPNRHSFGTVVPLNGIVHQYELIADSLANFPNFFHVSDVARDGRSGSMLAPARIDRKSTRLNSS